MGWVKGRSPSQKGAGKKKEEKERKKEGRRGEKETRWRAEVGGTYFSKNYGSIVLLLRVQLFVLNYSLSFSPPLIPVGLAWCCPLVL